MHSSVILLIGALAAVATSTPTLAARQTSTTIARTPEGTPIQLEDTIDALCQPSLYTWKRGSLNEKKAAALDQYSEDELYLTFKNSPFPCERVWYHLVTCTPSYFIRRYSTGEPYNAEEETGEGTEAEIEKERECLCPSEIWELWEGCSRCKVVHGYGEENDYVTRARRQREWIRREFCEERMLMKNYYHLVESREFREALEEVPGGNLPESGVPDWFPGKTEVSYYYTSGVTASRTGSEAKASATATAASAADGDVTEIKGTVTNTSSGGSATGTVSQGSAVSTAAGAASSAPAAAAAANELKAGGGLVLAVLCAMALL